MGHIKFLKIQVFETREVVNGRISQSDFEIWYT